MKKELIFLLTAATFGTVCFSNLTAGQVSADVSGKYEYTVTSKSKKTCTIDSYNGKGKDVKVPAKIKGYKVTVIGNRAFADNTKVKTISLPDTVTSIGEMAFDGCTSLKKINIPKKVTKIGFRAFSGTSLKSIKLPKIEKIEDSVFESSNIKSVTLSDGLKTIGENAFQNCEKLEKINIPKSVTSIGSSAFDSCYNLKKIDLPKGIKSIEPATFCCCNSLEEVKRPDSVKQI